MVFLHTWEMMNMQAITTRILPATNTKPTRIKAFSASGISVTVSADHSSHQGAVRALCQKLNWTGRMIGGGIGNGGDMVFVFVDDAATFEL